MQVYTFEQLTHLECSRNHKRKEIGHMKLPKGINVRHGKYVWSIMVNGQRKTGTATTLEQAVLLREKARMKLQIEDISGEGITISQLQELTIRTRWEGQKSEDTHRLNSTLIVRFFGENFSVERITTQKVQEFVEHLKKNGNTGGTINRKLSCLSTMLSTASENDYHVPDVRLRRSKEYKGRDRFLSNEEEQAVLALLGQWGAHDFKDVFVTLLDTGMRCGELYDIHKSDIDLTAGSSGIIHLWRTKGDKPRSVPMTKRVREIVVKRLQLTEKLVFPITKEWLRGWWNRTKATLGLEDDDQFVPHILRHTCASRLVQGGVSLVDVQLWMGHASVQSTMRYAHLAPTTLYKVVSVLDKNIQTHKLL